MTAETKAVLDACVLIPMPLADTLLRLAERPRLYSPQWTDMIMREVSRNLVLRFNKTAIQVANRESEFERTGWTCPLCALN